MISTEDPRIPAWLRQRLHGLLHPGETMRRPKRNPIPSPEDLRSEYDAMIVNGQTGWSACVSLGEKYERSPNCIRRRIARD